jgi:putative FmdB family regulatory protein
MPLYEYQCENCGAVEEISRSVASRNDPMNCGQLGCDGSMVLVPSLGAFALKGGGWTPKGSQTPTASAPKRKRKGLDMTGDRNL